MEADQGARDGKRGGFRKTRKVQYGYYPQGPFMESESAKPHPVIRIAGKYLERFGFKIGDAITVEIEHGTIMVRRLAEPDGEYAGQDKTVHSPKPKEKSHG